MDTKKLADSIRKIPDYPKPGILFYDITTMIGNDEVFSELIESLVARYRDRGIDFIAGIESRGFIFGAALAYRLGIGFVMARKAGKLPGVVYQISYQLEYGTASLAIPKDSFKKGQRVLLIDDLMATGGTFAALEELVGMAGGEPVAALAVIRLKELDGDSHIHVPCASLLDL